jgi:glycosyltransferase involved in cell wall biosynthesis
MLHVFNRPLAVLGSLRIGFIDFSGWDYHALTPDSSPMGGAQSALCYLTRALVQRGHDVFQATRVRVPGDYGGVHCLNLDTAGLDGLRALKLDACVCVMSAGMGVEFRQALGTQTRVVLWTGHAADQPAVQKLRHPAELQAYDGFAFVSQWQAGVFEKTFGVPRERIVVLGNAVAPAFVKLFPAGSPIAAGKPTPPILAYTSTPYRGLILLLDVFPRIREKIAGARLRIYSSMKVYRTPADEDEAEFGGLYDRFRKMEGVEYFGSLPQAELARQMRDVTILAYPNIFAETSCIAALEALAAGCRVVTSRLGALPETMAGFAELVDMGMNWEDYVGRFAEAVVREHQRMQELPEETETQLRRQVDFMNECGTWGRRAAEWEAWLRQLCR